MKRKKGTNLTGRINPARKQITGVIVFCISLIFSVSSPASSFKKAWPLNFKIKKFKLFVNSIVRPGENINIEVPVKNNSKATIKTILTFKMFDFWEKEQIELIKNIVLKINEEKKLKLTFKSQEKGIYKISVSFTINGKAFRQAVASFAVWPLPNSKNSENSKSTFFRDVITAWEKNGEGLEQAARLGQTWAINHDMMQATWWNWVQEKPGDFNFKKLDYQIKNCKKYGINILGEFMGIPGWAAKNSEVATKKSKKSYPLPVVPKIELWRKYVHETVSNYKNDIKFWQVGNEPHVSLFWGGSIKEFAQCTQVASEEAKKVDPECTVLGSGLGLEQVAWNEEFAKAGGFKNFDIVSIHNYIGDAPPEIIYNNLSTGLQHLRSLLKKYPPYKELPIWNTEGGTYVSTWLDGVFPNKKVLWRIHTYHLIKFYAIEMSLGIRCHFYYMQNTSYSFASLSDLDINNAPKPLLMARIAMQEQIDSLKYCDTFRGGEQKGRIWAVLYKNPKGNQSVAICWAGEKGEVNIAYRWGNKLKDIYNIMGNKTGFSPSSFNLTEEPVYLYFNCSAMETKKLFEKAKVLVIKQPLPLSKKNESVLKPKLPPVLANYAAPKENPEGNFTVDLRPYCNMGFADENAGDGKGGWRDEGPLNDMRCMTPGKQRYYGVPFDIIDPASNNGKSIITMKGMSLPCFPNKIEIDLKNTRCRSLYFLHSSSAARGLAWYEIKYTDGKVEKLPLIPGKNTNNWWLGYTKGEVSKPVPFLAENTMTGKPGYRYLRVWEWQNKRPEVPVKSLALVVREVKHPYQATSLIGITGTKWGN